MSLIHVGLAVWFITDLSVGPEKLMSMKRGVKINHMYGMLAICRKKSLFRSLTTMRKLVMSTFLRFSEELFLQSATLHHPSRRLLSS